MKDFYYCQDWGTFLDVPNILLSYGVVLYPNGRIRPFDFSHAEKIFLDCGAYTLRNTFSKFPIDRYIEWIRSFDQSMITHAATVDIIGDFIETVKSGLECMESDSSIPWVPVLQGSTIREYAECVRLYEKAGIDLSDRLVAVGGLKMKRSRMIRKLLSSLSHLKIHAFGLTLTNLRNPVIWNSVHSTDSGTWKGRPDTTQEKYLNLEKFKTKLEGLRFDYECQTKLE